MLIFIFYLFLDWKWNSYNLFHNSVVVGSSTLCDGLYMIDLMQSLFHFSYSASFVNVVVVSKCSRNIETSSMLWHRHFDHIFRPRIERLIKDGILVNLYFFLILILMLIVLKGI
jgi:hypothetical protein